MNAHQLAPVAVPVATTAGQLDMGAVLTKTTQLGPGQHATVSVRLSPGQYQLVCLMPGHYNAGQHRAFTVVR